MADYIQANIPAELLTGDTVTFNYTGNYSAIILSKGLYQFECWGAQGGSDGGGLGSLTRGIIELKRETTFYLYPGQAGSDIYNSELSFNGGGAVYNNDYNPTRGGGASDIRLKAGNWDDIDSLRSRIMVAGGGGGRSINWYIHANAGNGGGLVGDDAIAFNSHHTSAKVGTQISGGEPAEMIGNNTWTGRFGNGFKGSFGRGGDGGPSNGSSSSGCGGGGGCHTSSTISPGAGGSSFISGHPGCNAINSSGTHTGQPIHYSGLYFIDTVMQSGVRTEHGLVIITCMALTAEPDKTQYYPRVHPLEYIWTKSHI